MPIAECRLNNMNKTNVETIVIKNNILVTEKAVPHDWSILDIGKKLKMRRDFIQKSLYHLAPSPQLRRKTHYVSKITTSI